MAVSSLETIASKLASPGVSDLLIEQRLLQLKRRYDQPWRYYHNFNHPLDLFSFFTTHSRFVKDSAAIGWTIMYHDAIYDPTAPSGSNEELSARLAERELTAVTSKATVEKVAKYTRATASHTVSGIDPDLDFFLDLDLMILGAPSDRYSKYASDIRLEYSHVPADQYVVGRIAILKSLAQRVDSSGLFRTELFKGLFEIQAQENIAREIDQLSLRPRNC